MNPQSAQRATIKDVARAAGVSVTTVSNVLNGHVDAMSSATLSRIRELMASLNYQPSAIARSLVSGRRAMVALLLQPLPCAISSELLAMAQSRLRSEGRELALLAPGNSAEPPVACEAVIVAGLAGMAQTQAIQSVLETAGAVVTVGGLGPESGYANVSLGVDQGMAALTGHLAAEGHAALGWLAVPEGNALGAPLKQAFDAAVQDQGLQAESRWCESASGRDRDSVRRWTRELMSLRLRPTAIIAEDDALAALLIRELQTSGLRVPGDLAVAGFGDQPWCEWLSPRLTSVSIPMADGLARALDLALGQPMGGAAESIPADLACALAVRDSSGPARRGPGSPRPADTTQSTLW